MSIRFRPPSSRRSVRRAFRASRLELNPEWQSWVVDNLLLGAAPGALVSRLQEQGVPEALARSSVRELASSPFVRGAQAHVRTARRLSLLVRLLDTLSNSGSSTSIERRGTPPAGEFFERYFAKSQPVIFTDLLLRSSGRERWTPETLRARFGDVELSMTADRESDPDYDRNTKQHARPIRMADYVDLVLRAGTTNDFYMVANNGNITHPALAPLFDDLVFPEGFLDGSLVSRSSALWFGPAGTVTPLHHDTASILFCQLYGRKRWRLFSPLQTELLEHARSLYSKLDPEDPACERLLSGLRMIDLTLEPGETLFVPVGYWHHVRALDVSISFATTALARPNHFEWFRPGEIA